MASMAIPIMAARKIVCKVLLSKKDLNIFEGTISNNIAAICVHIPSLAPAAALPSCRGKQIIPASAVITPDTAVIPANQLKSMRKTRFIWAIFSMLNILAITDIKRKGMTIPLSNPKKASLKGVNIEADRTFCRAGAK